MDASIVTLIDNVSSTTFAFAGTVVTDYLPLILGLGFLGFMIAYIRRKVHM